MTGTKKDWQKYTSCKTFSSELVISFIIEQYRNAVDKSQRPLHTDFMIRLFNKVCSWAKISQTLRKNLKSELDRKILNIRIQANLRTKPARTYPPEQILDLIQKQWKRPIHGSGYMGLPRKYASAMAFICLLSGRRWVDITRLKWESLKIFSTKLGLFYKFYIPASKTNIRGQRIECVTIRKIESKKLIGPIKMLKQIRHWQGNPSQGFVFPCVHKNAIFTKDSIWEAWSSYRCKGHWVNKTKTECLGQIDGDVTLEILQRFATKLGWETVPTKHTFRRLVTLLHKRNGLSREQINELMGWVPHSNMPTHYAAEQDSMLESAPAYVFAKELEPKSPSKNLTIFNLNYKQIKRHSCLHLKK